MTARFLVVVAQPFKGTFSASEVAAACERAARAAGVEPVVLRGSDGGDGLLEALASQLNRRTAYEVVGPLEEAVTAQVGWLDAATAVIESRLVCGISLLPAARRNPLVTSTRGLGELISCVVADGAQSVYVGLGGSATMDGGLGMARAWGWVPRDRAGEPLPEGGGALIQLDRLDRGPRPQAGLIGLADVRNPLTGPQGARVYAAQKGADPAAEERLARGVERLVEETQPEGSTELAVREGAGSAGGLGFGLMLFGGGRLLAGARWVLERLGFDDVLAEAVGVLTGEGGFDATSLQGKLTGEVLERAARAGVPAGLLAPSAAAVPEETVVESGGGQWDSAELERRANCAVRRLLRLPPA
jgi:glycerate kinase